ncbi:HK97-gp10 family putative phage morphogenesis protein [Novosphingobium sp. 9]|uniref:HK97-gp10 family putative phage morphogenesis protein n=1 Tax=Novosphingobium sp. 9 TaxID=2025349 RepID=UPI0021B50035|nr:HK97-gp10 family putative phage morphogenesis protein [Novosphingobium sp. 9]
MIGLGPSVSQLDAVEVSSNAPYAAPLEFGTSKMAARPYMEPAKNAKRKAVTQLVRKAVDSVVRRSKSGDT